MDRPLDDLIKENQKPRTTKPPKGTAFKHKSKQTNINRSARSVEPYTLKNTHEKSSRRVSTSDTPQFSTTFVKFSEQPPPQTFKRTIKQDVNNNTTFQTTATASATNTTTMNKGIFDRIGTNTSHIPASGTSVTISNLNQDVTLADLSELSGTVGEVLSASFLQLNSQLNKLAKKEAIIIFARRSEALTFIQKFHGLTLDGTAMEIKLTGEGGKANPFNPTTTPISTIAPISNNRAGLFGTALKDIGYEGTTNSNSNAHVNPSFSINFGHSSTNQRDATTTTVSRQVSNDNAPQQRTYNLQGRGGSRGAGGRGGGGRGRGGGSRPVVSGEALDDALDAYMSK